MGLDIQICVYVHLIYTCRYGEIGRHARFRFSCRKVCRFDSCYRHQHRKMHLPCSLVIPLVPWGIWKSVPRHTPAVLAQLVEHGLCNPGVTRSKRVGSARKNCAISVKEHGTIFLYNYNGVVVWVLYT